MRAAADSPRRMDWSAEIKARIRRRYARLAGDTDIPLAGARRMREDGYPEAVIERVPPDLAAGYSGCGFPLAGVSLASVRHAVDLGCGIGIDAWWAASEMGPGGSVVAVDMTAAMLRVLGPASARGVAAGSWIFPVAGDLEHIPLASGIADLVVANASFNLAVNKEAAFEEAFRILKPGGQLAARDLVLEEALPREVLEDPLADVTSLGGVVTEDELRRVIESAGFAGVRIADHRPFSYVVSVQLNAVKPA
jgi:SAM-dependent methyltransferase